MLYGFYIELNCNGLVKVSKNHMHIVSGEMKAKKLESLEEENESFPDTDKFNSSPINQKKKHKIEL
jgi:hypothetical protein